MSCTESQTCSFLTPMDAVLDDIVRLSLSTPGRTFTLFNTFSFHRPLHHSILSHSPFSLPPFLPAPEKLLLFVMMFCPPAASAHSLPPPPTHKPCPLNLLFFDHKAEKNLVPVSISSPVTPQATKENHFHFFYSILHFHLSIRAKLSQGMLFMWLHRSWYHLNHCLAVSLDQYTSPALVLSLPRIVYLCLVASLTLLSFTARAWK